MMNCGNNPFFLDDNNKLCLGLRPVLPGWLFDKRGNYRFNFLSKICVAYHNPKRKDTFGKGCVRIRKISFKDKDGSSVELNSDIIPPPYAQQIRSRQILKIDIHLS